ncbi:MAG: hypothetical protein WC615_06535, partial [Mucilaginibacter sp.]|uniref:hypothetical protein n=1 Tax=Mucilaginibacter sp. TaxID=1882438 RepID=UPI003562113A
MTKDGFMVTLLLKLLSRVGITNAEYLIQSNQKSSQQKGFFAHKAFASQTGQNHGLESFCPA